MIKTQLTREDALKLLEVFQTFHKESQFKDEPFDQQRVWMLLDATITQPNQIFIAYDDDMRGFIGVTVQEHFFSGVPRVYDLGFYVSPEHRGSSLGIRLLNKAEEWAKTVGAKDITIFHNTGIEMEKSPKLFTRLGYGLDGYIFTKEL